MAGLLLDGATYKRIREHLAEVGVAEEDIPLAPSFTYYRRCAEFQELADEIAGQNAYDRLVQFAKNLLGLGGKAVHFRKDGRVEVEGENGAAFLTIEDLGTLLAAFEAPSGGKSRTAGAAVQLSALDQVKEKPAP